LETVETKRLYEAMFLVDSAQAASDWDDTKGAIHTILERADAEIVSLNKWSERKLAYDINHKARGTYILTYFKVDGARISGIEKDVRLSEKIMRVLILNTEERPQHCIDRDISAQQEAPQEPSETDMTSEQEEDEDISSESEDENESEMDSVDNDKDSMDDSAYSEEPLEIE
jgi:small subunit ribosomal protein S6